MEKCPNCGEALTKSIRLKKQYCSSCGYQIRDEDNTIKENGLNTQDVIEDTNKIDEDLKEKLDLTCPNCSGLYIYDELTGKIACGDCGFQPKIKNKDYIIDSDNSGVLVIECDKCGSNSGYKIIDEKIICKSCGDEINREIFEIKKRKKYIEKDGIVAKRLSEKEIKCKNCGGIIIGFKEYKTELCPNCSTINVVVEEIKSLRVEPDKIIPYICDQNQCETILENYGNISNIRIKPKNSWKKVYVPFWCFHYEGTKYWYKKKRSSVDEHNIYRSFELEKKVGEANLEDIWVSGREEFIEESSFDMRKIDMERAITYTPEALDTMTERYNVGTAEASVIGQKIVYDYIYQEIKNGKENFITLFSNEIELHFETNKNEFEQVLIPTWQNVVEIKNEEYFICINGQNGEIKIFGLDLEKKVKLEKMEETLEKGENILENIGTVLGWLNKNI